MKTQNQLNRMNRRNQIDYIEEWFAEVRGSLRRLGCTDFEEMATSFRACSVARYPQSVDVIDAAVNTARVLNSDGYGPGRNPVTDSLNSWLSAVAPGLMQ